jgi:parvulin-like peptidyl-prolyl isomerase
VALPVVVLLFATPAPALVVNKIIATVDGDPVTMYEVHRFGQTNLQGRQLAAANPSALLDAVITEKLIAREVSDKGIVVRDEDVTRYVEQIKERNKLDDAGLQQALAAQGLTMEAYRAQLRGEIQKAQLINREIRGKVSITPEDVRRYYDAHKEEYETPARTQVAQILLRLEPGAPPDRVAAITAKAEELRVRIDKGADFATMAREYSEDPSGQHGGDLGWFKPGELLDELERATAKLDVGEVSEPVRTRAGLHLLKVEAREGEAAEGYTAASDAIKEKLYNEALEERFQRWITEDLPKQHNVERRS